MNFAPFFLIFFSLLTASFSYARDYKPEPIEIYLTSQSQSDAATWEKSCPLLAKKLIVRTGPWAFGFFSSFKCAPYGQGPAATGNWILKVDSQSPQTTLEISQRIIGQASIPIASTSAPFHAKNIEWFQNEDFASILAASLLDQLPALMQVGSYQSELLVPMIAPVPPSKELVWGTLDFGEKTYKFAANVLYSVKTEVNGTMTKFILTGDKPKNNLQTIWIFNQRGPKARADELNLSIKRTHEKLLKEFAPDDAPDADSWLRILSLRYGVSLYKAPLMLKQAKLIDFNADMRGGRLDGLFFDYRYIPVSTASENGTKTSFSMSAGHLGYRLAWNLRKSILYSLAVIPQLGMWSITTSYPTTTDSVTTANDFSSKQELSVGMASVAEFEIFKSMRLQAIFAKDIAGPLLGSKTRTGVNAQQIGLNGYLLTGPSFEFGQTQVSVFVNGFMFVESIAMNKTGPNDGPSSLALSTGFVGIGSGFIW